MELKVKWTKLKDGNFCNLEKVILTNTNTFGVYIIWNADGNAVRLGQGDIADRLSVHRNDNEILVHKSRGLYTTWTSVSEQYVDGVERYLFDAYNPIVGERAPNAIPIPVNLPV